VCNVALKGVLCDAKRQAVTISVRSDFVLLAISVRFFFFFCSMLKSPFFTASCNIVTIFERKNPQHASLRRESKAVGPVS
jgi:hypothetical protein